MIRADVTHALPPILGCHNPKKAPADETMPTALSTIVDPPSKETGGINNVLGLTGLTYDVLGSDGDGEGISGGGFAFVGVEEAVDDTDDDRT